MHVDVAHKRERVQRRNVRYFISLILYFISFFDGDIERKGSLPMRMARCAMR